MQGAGLGQWNLQDKACERACSVWQRVGATGLKWRCLSRIGGGVRPAMAVGSILCTDSPGWSGISVQPFISHATLRRHFSLFRGFHNYYLQAVLCLPALKFWASHLLGIAGNMDACSHRPSKNKSSRQLLPLWQMWDQTCHILVPRLEPSGSGTDAGHYERAPGWTCGA